MYIAETETKTDTEAETMEILKECIGEFDGNKVESYSLRNSTGFGINALNYGAIITDILVPDKNGLIENVVMKYKDINVYKENPSYYGAVIGRTSGRIAEGKVTLNDKTLNFNKNYGVNQGHGGNIGFSKKFLDVITNCNEKEAYAATMAHIGSLKEIVLEEGLGR